MESQQKCGNYLTMVRFQGQCIVTTQIELSNELFSYVMIVSR